MDELRIAHHRMLGRVEASNIESMRAHRAGNFAESNRHARASIRRLQAARRIYEAMFP